MRGVTGVGTKMPLGIVKFQLTRLMRGVTIVCYYLPETDKYISTHTPHARRDLWIRLHDLQYM